MPSRALPTVHPPVIKDLIVGMCWVSKAPISRSKSALVIPFASLCGILIGLIEDSDHNSHDSTLRQLLT